MDGGVVSIIDRITPDEAHLPPSARTWARIIRLPHAVGAVLELRDPNSGLGGDPAEKPRHQYQVARERLWRRALAPAPLAVPTAGDDYDTQHLWELARPGCGVPWEWAREQGVARYYSCLPRRVHGAWDIHGDGELCTVAYDMPPASPYDHWADVTGVRCPDECDQVLVWYEAGNVPGYRVCMRWLDTDRYDRESLRHRWLFYRGVLILDDA